MLADYRVAAFDAADCLALVRAELGPADRPGRGHGYKSDGAVRRATVQIADWVRSITMDDGARPHSIVYRSRHVGGAVHAYGVRTVGQGSPVIPELVTADAGAGDRGGGSGTGGGGHPGTGSPSADRRRLSGVL